MMTQYLPSPDQKAFLEGISGDNGVRDYAIFLLTLSAGLRVSEVVGIDLVDLNLKAMTVRIRGKGNKERMANITEPCRDAIVRYLEEYRNLIERLDSPALFVSKRRLDRPTDRAVQKAMQKHVLNANLGGNGYPPTSSGTLPQPHWPRTVLISWQFRSSWATKVVLLPRYIHT